jgi:hypothetical protein
VTGVLKAILDTSVLLATDVPELEGELAISAARPDRHRAEASSNRSCDEYAEMQLGERGDGAGPGNAALATLGGAPITDVHDVFEATGRPTEPRVQGSLF